MNMEYFNLSIKEVVDKIKRNELSCEQLAHYYLDRKKYGLKNKLTIEEILDVYKDDMERYAPYGIEYLEKSNEYRHSDENEKEIKAICEDIEEKRKQVLNELEGFDACLMTGPTCMMHYVGVPSISVPFTTSDIDGFPRSMILYAKDEIHLLRLAKIVDELKDKISRTKYIK